MKRLFAITVLIASAAAEEKPRESWHVKYVAKDTVYLDGGRNDGLATGMKLLVERDSQPVAEIEISALADTSAVCDIKSAKGEIRPGDTVRPSAQDLEFLRTMRSSASVRNYPQVVTFTEGDPLDQEARESVPRPPSPEVNRVRARIGVEYSGIFEHGDAPMHSSEEGLVIQADIRRIGGSYWNLSGYWRGQLLGSSSGTQTLNDLLNRTYHLTLFYNNPNSAWVAGFGRFYLPWATSLDTIDGGYLGRRLTRKWTLGIFAGSTPDPTSWNYNPNRQLAGTFAAYEAGSYEKLRFTSTEGVAMSRINWNPERQFLFFENALYYKSYVSLYHSLEVDHLQTPDVNSNGRDGVSRSFLTLRLTPWRPLTFDISHTYFKDMPTFDPRLIGTGLVDRLLFQGASAGVRLQLPLHLSWYSSIGRSARSGDAQRSWNQMHGITATNLLHTRVQADLRYSVFDSGFGRGTYRTAILSRQATDNLRFEFQAGDQQLASSFTDQSRSRFLTMNMDWSFGLHYFLGSGVTVWRGRAQDYDQIFFNLGYRFR